MCPATHRKTLTCEKHFCFDYFNAPYFCIQSVTSVWKVANIFILNEFFWMELSPPQPVMHFGRIQEQQRNYRIWWKKNWYKTKNSICRGDLSEATNITLFSALSCQLSALLTQLWHSPFDIYQTVAKLAKYLEDFQDIFRRSSLI